MDRLGEAVHGFLAADLPGLPPEERPLLVSSLLARWDVAGALDPTAVVAAADRLAGWVRASYPGAAWRREVPLAVRLDAEAARTLATADAAGPTLGPGTVLVGTADLVLETTDGLVLIDHKTFPGGVTEAAAKAAGFAGQLAAYSLALRRATGSDLLAAYIHLPVLGLVYPVSPASSASRNDATLSSS
jgi:ATP-dependent helicase/nuclease subunit A